MTFTLDNGTKTVIKVAVGKIAKYILSKFAPPTGIVDRYKGGLGSLGSILVEKEIITGQYFYNEVKIYEVSVSFSVIFFLKIYDHNRYRFITEKLCGYNITSPPTMIRATSHNITVVFHTDGSVVASGWRLEWYGKYRDAIHVEYRSCDYVQTSAIFWKVQCL